MFTRVLFLALLGFSSASFAEVDCNDLLGGYRLLSKNGGELTKLEFGTAVQIQISNQENQNALYVGAIQDRVYFAPTDNPDFRRSLFYIRKSDLQVNYQTQQLVKLYSTSVPHSCAPQTAMACLEHLKQMGLLPAAVGSELETNRDQLYQVMQDRLHRESIESLDDILAIDARFADAKTRKEYKKVVLEKRKAAFAHVTRFFNERGIPTKQTNSKWALVRHLKKGLPAYISMNVTGLNFEEPEISNWNKEQHEYEAVTKYGAFPTPSWAPSNGGLHAVYALGVLPRTEGRIGFFMGKRLVIMDPIKMTVGVWYMTTLRLAGASQFILIGK